MVFFIEKDVGIKRCHPRDYLNHEEINRQYRICARADKKHRNKEERRVVTLVTEVRW
jgi:hypothetical protein